MFTGCMLNLRVLRYSKLASYVAVSQTDEDVPLEENNQRRSNVIKIGALLPPWS